MKTIKPKLHVNQTQGSKKNPFARLGQVDFQLGQCKILKPTNIKIYDKQ